MIGIQRDDQETCEFVTFFGVVLIYAILLIVVWVCRLGMLIALYFNNHQQWWNYMCSGLHSLFDMSHRKKQQIESADFNTTPCPLPVLQGCSQEFAMGDKRGVWGTVPSGVQGRAPVGVSGQTCQKLETNANFQLQRGRVRGMHPCPPWLCHWLLFIIIIVGLVEEGGGGGEGRITVDLKHQKHAFVFDLQLLTCLCV